MKSPADLASARRRRALEELRTTIATARAQIHLTVDRLFDATDAYLSANHLDAGDAAPMSSPRIVSVADAAVYLNISDSALRTLIDKGQMPCIRIPSSRGHRPIIRLDLDDVDRHIETLKQTA